MSRGSRADAVNRPFVIGQDQRFVADHGNRKAQGAYREPLQTKFTVAVGYGAGHGGGDKDVDTGQGFEIVAAEDRAFDHRIRGGLRRECVGQQKAAGPEDKTDEKTHDEFSTVYT